MIGDSPTATPLADTIGLPATLGVTLPLAMPFSVPFTAAPFGVPSARRGGGGALGNCCLRGVTMRGVESEKLNAGAGVGR